MNPIRKAPQPPTAAQFIAAIRLVSSRPQSKENHRQIIDMLEEMKATLDAGKLKSEDSDWPELQRLLSGYHDILLAESVMTESDSEA